MKAAEAAICPTMHAPPIEDLCVPLVSNCLLFAVIFPNDLPTTPVLELAKHITDRSSGSEDPKRYNDDKEADQEHNQNDAFEERKVLGGEGVERDRESSDSHSHEGPLPGFCQFVVLGRTPQTTE